MRRYNDRESGKGSSGWDKLSPESVSLMLCHEKKISHGNRGRTPLPQSHADSAVIGSLPVSASLGFHKTSCTAEQVSSSKAKYGTVLSAPLSTQPIENWYQHQQDTAGLRAAFAKL